MINVECPYCYFRFTTDNNTEGGNAFCNQCANQFPAEKFSKRIVLDSKNIQRSSATATTIEIIGGLFFVISIIILIGTGFKATPFSLVGAISGIFIYSFGKLIRLVTEIRWFAKIQAERDFRSRQ